MRGDYNSAMAHLEKALELRPQYPEARKNALDAKRLQEVTVRHRRRHPHAGDPVMTEWPTFRGSNQRTAAAQSGPLPALRPYWQFECDTIDSSPAIGGGRVYFGTQRGRLFCLDAFSGKEYWQFSANASIISSPALSEGYVYFGSEDDNYTAWMRSPVRSAGSFPPKVK